MVKAQKQGGFRCSLEPQEPLSLSQSHRSLEEDCPHPLSVEPTGKGTQAQDNEVCSPIREGPGAGVTQAQEEKAAAPHTSSEPPRLHNMGGGCPQRASHFLESRCLF